MEHHQQIVQFPMQIPANRHLLGDRSRRLIQVRQSFQPSRRLAQNPGHVLGVQSIVFLLAEVLD